jgi:hypothetical protein
MDFMSADQDQNACVYLEKTHTGLDEVSEFEEPGYLPAAKTHHYTCAHTGRPNGPDYFPAAPEHCTPKRSCFHGRGL